MDFKTLFAGGDTSLKFERITERLSFILMAGLIVLIAICYPLLPGTIYTHYGISGQPDGSGSKNILLIILLICILIFLLLSWAAPKGIRKFQDHKENSPGQIAMLQRLIIKRLFLRIAKLLTVVNCWGISLNSILAAFHQHTTFLLILIPNAALFITLIFYLGKRVRSG